MGIKKYNYITGEVEDTDSVYTSYYSDAWYNNEEYKIPPYIKYNGNLYWKIEGANYYNNYEGVLIPITVVVDMLDCGKAVAEDINITRLRPESQNWQGNIGMMQRILGGKTNDEVGKELRKFAREKLDRKEIMEYKYPTEINKSGIEVLNDLVKEKEMKKNVVLKKDFRGLKAGTEFAYDAKIDSWKFETSGEEISDNSYKSHSSKVQFSDSYVRSNPEVFEVPGIEDKKRLEKEEKIKNLENLVEKTLKEIDKLKCNDAECNTDECKCDPAG